jgi:hypothetical protein
VAAASPRALPDLETNDPGLILAWRLTFSTTLMTASSISGPMASTSASRVNRLGSRQSGAERIRVADPA